MGCLARVCVQRTKLTSLTRGSINQHGILILKREPDLALALKFVAGRKINFLYNYSISTNIECQPESVIYMKANTILFMARNVI
jgi:hypothetical protein